MPVGSSRAVKGPWGKGDGQGEGGGQRAARPGPAPGDEPSPLAGRPAGAAGEAGSAAGAGRTGSRTGAGEGGSHPEELVLTVPARNAVEAFARAIEGAGHPPEALVPRRVEVIRPGRRLAWWWIRLPVMRVTLAIRPLAEPAGTSGHDPAAGRDATGLRPTLARVHQGQVQILPGSPDEPAILVPGPGVVLRVNGTAVAEPVAVTAADRVEVRVEPLPDGLPAQGGSPRPGGPPVGPEPSPVPDPAFDPGPGSGAGSGSGPHPGPGPDPDPRPRPRPDAPAAAAPSSIPTPGQDPAAAVRPPSGPGCKSPVAVRITPDGLEAEVRVPPVRRRVLKEAGPGRVLHLETTIVEGPPPDLTAEAIRSALAAAGVVRGIDTGAVARVAAEGAPRPVTIARGRAPRDGEDGKLVIALRADTASWDSGSDPDPDPDRLLSRSAPAAGPGGPWPISIPEGSLVGWIVPPQAGQPGWGVDGRVLPAREGRAAQVRCGAGVALVRGPGGRRELRALRQGRPVVQRVGRLAWYVDVVPLRVCDGDVTAATGPVVFDGDVVVTGSVREGGVVAAGGRIHVAGEVDHGVLEAAGDVTVQGAVVQARVVAGARALLYTRLRSGIEPLREGCRRIEAAMRLVEGAASFQNRDIARFGPGRLVRLLVDMKFRDVRERARDLHRLLAAHRGPLDPPVEALRRPVAELAGTVGDRFDLPGLIAALGEAAAFLQWFEVPAPATATVGSVHNAVVEATGAVRVGPGGTYHARLWAGERATVQGAVVGGSVEAGRAVHVLEAGSLAQPATVLAVGEGGTIRAGFAHENVWLRVGDRQRRLAEPRSNLRVVGGGTAAARQGAGPAAAGTSGNPGASAEPVTDPVTEPVATVEARVPHGARAATNRTALGV